MREIRGTLRKMQVQRAADSVAQYQLMIGDELVPANELIGSKVRLQHHGHIQCVHCQRKIKKSFAGGFCYPCFRSLAQCDLCVMKPETCHFDRGTCREPEWGQTHCMIPHSVYISNSSGPKIGITRSHQKMRRWIDQGAVQAIELCVTPTRKEAGLIEVAIAKHIPDKTNWRKMLMTDPEPIDLPRMREELAKIIPANVRFSLSTEEQHEICFPVTNRPEKLTSLSLDGESAAVEGTLLGIKAQYLILSSGVLNIPKFQGYEVELAI